MSGPGDASPARRRILVVGSVPHAHHPRHHYRLAAALGDAGYDVTTLAPQDLSPGQVDAVPVEYLPPREGRLRRMTSGPATVLAAARRKPVAVHVVSLDLLPWAALLRLTRRCRVLYDSNEEYDSMMLIKEWLPAWVRPLLGRFVAWAEPALARTLDAATTALPATQRKFERHRVNSVLVRNFPPASLTEDVVRGPEFTHDVLIGGSIPEDQIPLLAETAAALEAKGVEVRWLVAARSYGPRERGLLESALDRAGVRHRFDLRYNRPFAEMKGIMAGSRIGFVLYPSDVNYSARIPLRIFEYMAAGLPFVASDLATTSEFTRGRGVADLVPAGDVQAYADAIAALLADPGRQEEMSRRGPVLAGTEYNWARESGKLVALYRGLVGPPA
ncbi:MAG TPA: glycosyltransferase [Solirubrobacteraceae bacterium]|nr:glycosyltransferase [Solirubrobacteraceae bacterium]